MALANDEAMNNVAAYVAKFEEKLVAVTEKTSEPASTETAAASFQGSAENGKVLYAICVSCHGADGAGNKALNAPRIAGQQVWYVKRQLAAFKSGMRGTHSEDIYGRTMRPMAMTLPSDQAMADISAYVNSLQGQFLKPLFKEILLQEKLLTRFVYLVMDQMEKGTKT